MLDEASFSGLNEIDGLLLGFGPKK
jgi:hypothetical protein